MKGTLNFFLLFGVKNKYPDVYRRFNRILMNGMEDLFDAFDILYTAYLCALPEGESPMDYLEFIKLFDDDTPGVMRQAGALMGRKKKRLP